METFYVAGMSIGALQNSCSLHTKRQPQPLTTERSLRSPARAGLTVDAMPAVVLNVEPLQHPRELALQLGEGRALLLARDEEGLRVPEHERGR